MGGLASEPVVDTSRVTGSAKIRTWAALVTVTAVLAGSAVGGVPAGAAAPPLPERLAHVGDSRQVIVVTSANWSTSFARLQAWQQRADGTWTRVMRGVPARLGWSGFAREKNRLQNTGKTPAGTFALPRGFGLDKPKSVDLRYRKIDNNDWWPYDPQDPKTYNVMQFRRPPQARWRTDWAEHLRSYTKQYRYSVVLDYNLPSGIKWRNGQRIATDTANTSKGGGIFLHVNGSGATAGCVSVSRERMRRILRWLNPEHDPVIVMGPGDVIERM